MRRAAARSDAMTQIGMEDSSKERTQRIYARVAGFLFLWLIVTGLAGALTISHIVGSGTFAETAKRVVASERLYRVALSSELIETLSALLLAFALYVTLKPVDKLLAQIAMYWRLGESFIGGVGMIVGFLRLHLYSSPQLVEALGTDQSQALVGLTRHAGFIVYNISAIFFSIGSILFSYLFFKSRYIPQDPVSIRRICLGRRDDHVFWQSDLSRTRSDAPIRLGTDGHRRSHNRLLADVVCGKDPIP